MRAAILGSAESWYTRDLLRAGAARHELQVLPFAELNALVGQQTSHVRSQGTRLDDVSAILVRMMPPGSLEQVVLRMDLLHACQDRGVHVVNSPRAVEVAVDKFLATLRLQQAGLPVPPTHVSQTAEQAWEGFERLGGDVVVKPIFGSEGRGIIRLSDPTLARRAFTTLARIDAVIYQQKFVPHHGYDWRVLVVDQQLLGMERFNPHDWRTNIGRGAEGRPLVLDERLRQLAQQAALAVGARWAGVDLLPARDGSLYVLEVNAVPGWRRLAEVTQTDVAALLWRDLERLVQA